MDNTTVYLILRFLPQIILFALIVLNFIHYAHMFQLNSYSPIAQMKWYGKNILNLLGRHSAYIIALFLFIFNLFIDDYRINNILVISFFVFLLVSTVFSWPRKAKKKLVMTPRVIRMFIAALLIYVILSFGVLYLVDWIVSLWVIVYFHAIILPILSLFTPFIIIIANFINKPIEKTINNYYISDAKRIIGNHKNLITIGITGSYGKTSVKFYLNELLSAKFNTLMTPESYNTTMGVVKTVRNSLSATHEIFVCEMGANRVGDIKEICDIVKPSHSVLTAIGEQHLETFKSFDNIIKTKFEIADAITEGYVFLNYDNEHIRNRITDKKIITYGLHGLYDKFDYCASDIKVSVKGTSFMLHAGRETAQFETALIGEHNVENIVGAIAVAHFMGVSLSELYLPVKRLKSVPHRMELINHGDRVIIDDSFNSNPKGAKAALNVLKMLNGERFLVTPGMIELGEREHQLNKELGENAADCCDYAVLVGEKQAVPISEGLKEKGFPVERIYVAKTLKEGMAFVDSIVVADKKIILLENDLPDNY